MKRSNWTYRLIRFTGDFPAQNFCPYVRQVVARLFFAPVILAGVLLVISIITFPFWQWFVSLPDNTDFILRSICVVLWTIATGISIAMYRENWGCSFNNERNKTIWYHKNILAWIPKRQPKPYTGPSAFAEWRHATHDKICPAMKFED